MIADLLKRTVERMVLLEQLGGPENTGSVEDERGLVAGLGELLSVVSALVARPKSAWESVPVNTTIAALGMGGSLLCRGLDDESRPR